MISATRCRGSQAGRLGDHSLIVADQAFEDSWLCCLRAFSSGNGNCQVLILPGILELPAALQPPHTPTDSTLPVRWALLCRWLFVPCLAYSYVRGRVTLGWVRGGC